MKPKKIEKKNKDRYACTMHLLLMASDFTQIQIHCHQIKEGEMVFVMV